MTIRTGFLWLLPSLCLLAAPAYGEPEKGKDWWSLKALERPAVPAISGMEAERARTPIDHFIIASQAREGLALSPEADRRTLIRRLYFDLTGLPPSPEEVAAFVRDDHPEAYEELVDRLLDSPRYGERWARHWLDVVHYGDTHGYDKDKLRPNAWPYRDYVIRAFNEDKQYARFVQEQLAGDVRWPDTVDGVVATGFIAAGPWDFIGHAEVSEDKIDGKVARHLDRDDMVATTMNSFCSVTVQCAQCHDHKRDPISMEDYYSLQAVFAALDRADRPYDATPENAKSRIALTEEYVAIGTRMAALAEKMETAKSPEMRALEEEIAVLEKAVAATAPVEGAARSERYGYHSEVASAQETEKWVQVDLGAVRPLDKVLLFAADEYGFSDFGFPHRFRVEVSDEADFSERRVLADETAQDYPRPGSTPVGIEGKGASGRYVRITATKLWNRRQQGLPLTGDWIFALGEMVVVSEGQPVSVVEVTALDSIEAGLRWGKADLIDGIYGAYPLETLMASEKDKPGGDAVDLLGLLESRARAEREKREQLASLRERHDAMGHSASFFEASGKHKELALESEKVAAALRPLDGQRPVVYAGTIHTGSGTFAGTGANGGKPRAIHILARGDVTKPGAEVGAGTVDFIPGVPSRFSTTENEGARRVALADWIVRKDNPLTWRTIVNRVWLYHFGRGIVDSPNDFGHMGQLPSHPELLDWLAVEFRDGNQSIKDLHRLILKSAVYRQSSDGNAAFEKIDGGNQYLWRMNRRKLEAEALRDSVLLVSGKLDATMYGPGFQDFIIEKPEHSPHYMYGKHDPDDAATHRRSIYRFIVRSQPQPFMDTLDCADPSLLVDKRNETLTALQALAFLNNKFVVRMAEHFATRLEAEASDRKGQIERAYQLTMNRSPSEDESAALLAYADKYGLPSACRLILNLNEFAFAD